MTSNASQFRQIVCLDQVGITPSGIADLQAFSKTKVIHYTDPPTGDAEIRNRIKHADCVLVSWDTQISGDVLRALPQLAYVGMCCSLYDERSANVDIKTASELGITVRGVRDYGDEGLVEFIFAQSASEGGPNSDEKLQRTLDPGSPTRQPDRWMRRQHGHRPSAAKSQTKPSLRLIVLIAVTTGMRAAEIFALRWSDVMYGEGLLAVRAKLKGGENALGPSPSRTGLRGTALFRREGGGSDFSAETGPQQLAQAQTHFTLTLTTAV